MEKRKNSKEYDRGYKDGAFIMRMKMNLKVFEIVDTIEDPEIRNKMHNLLNDI